MTIRSWPAEFTDAAVEARLQMETMAAAERDFQDGARA